MARLRAVEHGRAAVVATTSGISALVRPDGSVTARSRLFEPAVLDADLPLSSSLTPATRFGPAIEIALVLPGLLPLAGAAVVAGRRLTGWFRVELLTHRQDDREQEHGHRASHEQ